MIKFIDKARWQLINSFRGGASHSTWKKYKGNDPNPFDDRAYGVALSANYPNLKNNADGNGNDSANQLLIDGLARRSVCMVTAALLANADVDSLDEQQQQRLDRVIELAKNDPDLKHVFAQDDEVEF